MNQDLAFAKELAKYKDQWVALQGKRVVAAGNSVREVQEKVARGPAHMTQDIYGKQFFPTHLKR